MSDARTPLEELVAATADDWSDVGWVYSTCLDFATGPDQVRALALSTIEEGLVQGLLVAGDLTASGFQPWDLEPAAAQARIRGEWLRTTVIPEPTTIAWFDLTPAGEALAQAIFAREGTA
jgi:hypothetical protein